MQHYFMLENFSETVYQDEDTNKNTDDIDEAD